MMRPHRMLESLPLLAAGLLTAATAICGPQTLAAAQSEPPNVGPTVHAFRLYKGTDGNSHVQEGYVPQGSDFPVTAVKFEITPPHSPPVWHNDPQHQYVVTMTGTLKFSTRTGETFVLHAGDVLIAEDDTGTGHGWEMLGDEPWTRTYALLPPDGHSAFVALVPGGKPSP